MVEGEGESGEGDSERGGMDEVEGDEMDVDDDQDSRAVDNLLEAIEIVYGEEDGDENDDSDEDSGEGPDSEDDDEAAAKVSSWRKCPVPGCGVEKNRLSRINRHLRDDHDVPLEIGGGGDMVALRARQDAQFQAWCVANGLRGDTPREQPIDGEILWGV